MKVLVLGGGVIGVTSAYFLRKLGHDVTLIERQPAAAMETSFANAGEVSAGHAGPWATPEVPLRAMSWLLMRHGPLVIRPRLDWRMLQWLMAMLRECTPARYATNKARMLRVAEYSRDCLRTLREETNIHYDERTLGTLQLFRDSAQLDNSAHDIAVLKDHGITFELFDRAGCIEREPALAKAAAPFIGGLFLPGDETGDCHLFTQRLAATAQSLGVGMHYDTRIQQLTFNSHVISSVTTDRGEFTADAYVVAMGSYSPLLLRPLHIALPIYPVKGYSITVPIANFDAAPVSTVMDETYKVGITRLGDRMRVGGTAELGGYDLELRQTRREALEFVTRSLFPDAGDIAAATFWCGLRPMTPDGTPIIGRTPYRNLFLNTGHGTLGWTMACGSARVLADLVSDREPEIEAGDLGVQRYCN